MDQTWPLVDIILPTCNNRGFLEPCLRSLFREQAGDQIFRLWIVNNGDPGSCAWATFPGTTVLEPGEDLGWTRALATAMPFCTAPIVGFMNDDIFIPPSSRGWMNRIISHFEDERVAGVGPATTARSGPQSMFTEEPDIVDARMLLGYCIFLWRETLDAVGGIDISWFIGDDLDLSIRLRDAGHTLVVDKRELVYFCGGVDGVWLYEPLDDGDDWRRDANLQWIYERLIAQHGWEKTHELTAPDPPAFDPSPNTDAI